MNEESPLNYTTVVKYTSVSLSVYFSSDQIAEHT